MNQETLTKLAGILDAGELRREIEALCLPFGGIKDMRLLRDENRKEYLCFVELDSPSLNSSMMRTLGGINYGNSVAFRIPFNQ